MKDNAFWLSLNHKVLQRSPYIFWVSDEQVGRIKSFIFWSKWYFSMKKSKDLQLFNWDNNLRIFSFNCIYCWPVKSDTVLPTARHCCDNSSKGAALPGCNDAEMGPANSLHASAYYSEYNERFDSYTWIKKFQAVAISVVCLLWWKYIFSLTWVALTPIFIYFLFFWK